MSTATSFVCPECQRVLRTPSAVPPGKKIKCPACSTIFAPAAAEARPASPIRRQNVVSPPPAPRRPRDEDDDHAPRRTARRAVADDDAWDDDRPARKRPRKRSALPLILGGSAALLLLVGVVVGGFVWPGFFLGGGGGALAGKPSENTTTLLNFMPADPVVMVGVDLSRLQKRNKLDDLLLKLPQQIATKAPDLPAGLRNLFQDVDACVMAFERSEQEVFAVKTKAAFKIEDVLKDTKAVALNVRFGKAYRIPGRLGGRDVLVMLDPAKQIAVMSRLSELEFVKVLANPLLPDGECRALVDKVGGAPAWFVVQMKGDVKQGFDDAINQAGMFGMMNPDAQKAINTLRQIKGVVGWLKSTDTLTVNVGFVMPNAGDASRLRREFTDSWNAQAKDQMRQAGNMVAMMAPAQGAVINAAINDFIDSFRAESDGTLAWISSTFSNNTTQQVAQLAEQNLGGAFGNFGGGNFAQPPAFDKKAGIGPVPPRLDKVGPKVGQGPPPFQPPPLDKGFNVPPDRPDLNDKRFRDPRTQPLGPDVGKVVLQRNEQLTKADPPCPRKPGGNQKLYTIRMTAGKTYQVDLVSTGPGTFGEANWDNYLYFEDSQGKLLKVDDDGGEGLNARIVFQCDRTADYRIIVTALRPGNGGPFSLTVREQ